MRHGKKINHLGRTSSHRAAMLSNMASSLIKHKRIVTTVAKAKSLRVFVEPLITRSKNPSTHNYRTVFSYLRDKQAVTELFSVVGEKVANRPGGYTRILKTGNRAGDNAEMAMIELVDFNEFFEGFNADKKKSSTRRSRRGGSKSKAASKKEETVEVVAEEVATEEVVTEEATVEAAADEVVAEEVLAEEAIADEAPETSADESAPESSDEEASEEEKKD